MKKQNNKEYNLFSEFKNNLLRNNKILKDHALLLSHDIRRPVANLIGLINLLDNFPEHELINKVKLSVHDLDEQIKMAVKKIELEQLNS